jgi:TRAP-type mannitol/chloroaromatic compound transport system substrate-binding protein
MKKLTWMVLSVLVIAALILTGCASSPATQTAQPTTSGPATSPAAQTINWKIQSAYPHGDLSMETLKDFAAEANKLSGGKINISIFADPDIVPGDQLLETTKKGTLEMLQAGGTYWGGVVPVGDIEFGMPYAYTAPKAKDFSEAANSIREFFFSSGLVELLREEYAKQNVYWLDMHTYGPCTVVSRKPVKTINDFKGLKVRTQGIWSAWLAMNGAAGTEGGGGDTYLELKLGTLDAAQWDISSITGLKWNEVAPYLWQPYDADQLVGHILVNLDKWKALSPDQQKVLQDAGKKYWDLTVENYGKELQAAEEIRLKGGFQYSQMDAELLKARTDAAYKVWDDYAKHDAASAKAVQLIKDWRAKQ